jgi:hypothetical protein
MMLSTLGPPRVIVPHRQKNISPLGRANRKERCDDLVSTPFSPQKNGAKSYSRVQLLVAECGYCIAFQPNNLTYK